jgi:hypothetical protein
MCIWLEYWKGDWWTKMHLDRNLHMPYSINVWSRRCRINQLAPISPPIMFLSDFLILFILIHKCQTLFRLLKCDVHSVFDPIFLTNINFFFKTNGLGIIRYGCGGLLLTPRVCKRREFTNKLSGYHVRMKNSCYMDLFT